MRNAIFENEAKEINYNLKEINKTMKEINENLTLMNNILIETTRVK